MDHAIVAYTFLASTDCSERKDTVYLVLAWPVGQIVTRDELGAMERTRYFVRGTMGDGFQTRGVFEPDGELPPNARTPDSSDRATGSSSANRHLSLGRGAPGPVAGAW